MDIFKELKKLNFPLGEYVVIGSGLLAVLGLREARDLDVAVSAPLAKKLINSGQFGQVDNFGFPKLKKGNVEIITHLGWDKFSVSMEEAINSALIINGYPFMNPDLTIRFKTALGREKDFSDIKLLKDYLHKEKYGH